MRQSVHCSQDISYEWVIISGRTRAPWRTWYRWDKRSFGLYFVLLKTSLENSRANAILQRKRERQIEGIIRARGRENKAESSCSGKVVGPLKKRAADARLRFNNLSVPGLRTFVRIEIFMNATEKVEAKQRLVLLAKNYNEWRALDILYICVSCTFLQS